MSMEYLPLMVEYMLAENADKFKVKCSFKAKKEYVHGLFWIKIPWWKIQRFDI